MTDPVPLPPHTPPAGGAVGERKASSGGRRERKKAQTRASIQSHALNLFTAQGFDATTLAQIAEAADVSESTLLRYFATKQDLVLWDDFDVLISEAFRAHALLDPISALRTAISDVFGDLSVDDRARMRERISLLVSVPPLAARLLSELRDATEVLAALIAERSGRTPDDPAAAALAGAVIGVALSALFAAERDPAADIIDLLDRAMDHLAEALSG